MDVEQRARELLAAQCEIDGMPEAAEMVRAGTFKGDAVDGFQTTIRAIIAALTPPEGYVLVPVEPTETMLDAGRAAVMAEHCAGPKWTPRQHFEASGRSTAGIPEDVLDERGPLTKESTAAMVFGSMLAARPEVKP
ncbi:hypothetical protein ORG27_14725 [Stenotrophomonas lactitubi]|uniref:hypothetical protein n=1 Tax=Stenotrophomonas lactitubi TaxID=2045214 RepID=UPI002248F489|nr:hypothetical protein [Stenotrophomonas lactitubi]MCX2894831.1 hypothetical protein [Stenotrophomonas lactitubi]